MALMRAGNPGKAARGSRGPLLAGLLVLAGCRSPAAHGPADPDSCGRLACQVVGDTATAFACRPLRSTYELVAEPAQHAVALAQGAVGRRILMPLMPPPPDVGAGCHAACHQPDSDAPACDGAPARICLYPDGGEALAVLEALIASATTRIDVLMYQWENDPVGAAIADRLAQRAAAGVRVRVLVDGGGNLLFGCPCQARDRDVNRVVCALGRKPNVQVIRARNPFARFDHRKLLIADGRAAWTGGRNFTASCFFTLRDLTFTVEGPLVAELSQSFEASWRDQGGQPVAAPPAPVCQPGEANALAHLVETAPLHPDLERTLLRAADSACHHLYLENFTFADGRLVYHLARARQRGVDVRVVLTLSCCCKVVNRTNRVVANRLLAAGVRVYVHPDMTHVKAAVADGRWLYLGSGNFDPLSLRHNRELGFSVTAGPLIAEVEQRLFGADLCPAWELKEPLPVTAKDYGWELLSGICL